MAQNASGTTVAAVTFRTRQGPAMSKRDPDHPLRVDLISQQEQLQENLEEVCEDVAIQTSSTEKLIRIEETLAAASQTAKEVISLRRRLDRDQGIA
jgi:hypothetical protein